MGGNFSALRLLNVAGLGARLDETFPVRPIVARLSGIGWYRFLATSPNVAPTTSVFVANRRNRQAKN